MASIHKTETGYRAFVTVNGSRRSKRFKTKRDANEWVKQQEIAPEVKATRYSVKGVIEDYIIGRPDLGSKDALRLRAFVRDYPQFSNKPISDLSSQDMAVWRDARLTKVKASTVLKDWTILDGAFKKAVEYGYITKSPLKGLKRPPAPEPRDRIVTDDELKRIIMATGYSSMRDLNTIGRRIGAMTLFAVETGLRCQEICLLTWDNVDGNVLYVRKSKTHAGLRGVPLSKRAVDILNQLRRWHESQAIPPKTVFNISGRQRDSHFRKYRDLAGLSGFTFHDLRATAITRLAKKVDVLDLARIIGHKNIKKLMIYYREDPKAIAKRLG